MKTTIFKTDTIVEIAAVLCSLLYTILYIEGSVWCWLFGGLGALLFVFLTWKNKIFAEAFLQLFYVAFAVYGFITMGNAWPEPLHVPWVTHLIWIGVGALGLLVVGAILKKTTETQMPWVDSFTTLFSLIATWHMVNNVHENWLYFMAVNAVAVFLYYKRGMKLSSLLFVLYFALAVKGYFQL